jgi:hypothetical protein
MMEKIEEKEVDLEEVGFFKLGFFKREKGEAYICISKKILRRWEDLGFSVNDLFLHVYMSPDGFVGMIPVKPDNTIRAIALRQRYLAREKGGKGR